MKKVTTIQKILDAATKEFGQKGYKLASTNQISSIAGVSKGSIFAHFHTKSGLYYALYQEKMKKLLDNIEHLDYSKMNDVYEKMLSVTVWKMKYFNDHPLEAKILLEAITNPPNELKETMKNEMDNLLKLSVQQFFNEIDMSKFKEDYTKEDVLEFIQFSLSGIQNSLIKPGMTFEDMDAIKAQSMKYLKTVIKGMEK